MRHPRNENIRKKIFFLILVLVLVLLVTAPVLYKKVGLPKKAGGSISPEAKVKINFIKWFPFTEENSLKDWEEKIFKGKVIYRVEKDSALSYVRADSSSAASALYYKISLDARRKHPAISWKWNVVKFPVKKSPENLGTSNEDDFAARVYVIFPAKFLLNSKVIEYIWSETLPVGSTGTSPYSKNIKLIVARSGPGKEGQWFPEERDIISDYIKVFGRPPEHDIGAIAFMTNTEHTQTSAEAMYDDIRLGYKEGALYNRWGGKR